MDTISHGLWALAITRMPNRKLTWRAPVFFAMLPDFIWYPFYGLGLVAYGLNLEAVHAQAAFQAAYNVSHSLVTWGIVTLALILLGSPLARATWGWALHILIDIPGHEHTLTPFLWPIANVKIPGAFDWLTLPWFVGNAVTLALIFAILTLRDRRRDAS